MKSEIEKIVATFKANYKKASYWVQVLGALIVLGILVAHYAFGVNVNSDTVVMSAIAIGAVLSFWGVLTDNSIMESVGDTLKGNSNVYVKTADTVEKAIDTAVAQLQSAKANVASSASEASSTATSASEQSSELASAYSTAASAAAAGDTETATSAAALASSLVADSDSNAQSVTETTSESASQAGEK